MSLELATLLLLSGVLLTVYIIGKFDKKHIHH